MKIAIIGITGNVGQKMIEILDERNFPYTSLILVASEKSVAKKYTFKDKEYTIENIHSALAQKPAIALFSAGSKVSLEYAQKFADSGCVVIDNSSAWRMHSDCKLIVPEINGSSLKKSDKIIANPNCSTIQLAMTVAPLHKRFTIKRMVISTYQSITGSGKKAIEQYYNEIQDKKGNMVYPYPIFNNVIPHCDQFYDNGYTTEELKLIRETQKILNDNAIAITATAVRVPVIGGHSESVNIEFEKKFELHQIRKTLHLSDGITVKDNLDTLTYPMPLFANGKDDVFVGRIRRDLSKENSLNLWIVSDNLRKGAATNAIQIAEYLITNNLVQ